MRSNKPSRIVLLSVLVVLGLSIAVFLSITGITSALAADPTHEIELRDDALVVNDGTASEPLLETVSEMERIEITTVDGRLLVSTEPRNPPSLHASQREQAKQIVVADGSIVDHGTSADAVLYTIHPVFETTTSEQAAIVGAQTETRREYMQTVADTEFTLRKNATENSVVFERENPPVSEGRALVVVNRIDSDVRYSVVVDLDRETVETVVQFDPTGRQTKRNEQVLGTRRSSQ